MLSLKRILVLLGVLAAGYSCGQVIRFERYTAKDGLPSDEIYNLHQDRQGYLWVFTNYGAVKYNGYEFRPVLRNLPLEDAFIYSIYENGKGQKWIANSNAKIYKIVHDSAFIVKGTEAVSDSLRSLFHEIFQLYVDDSLNIYAITKGASYKFTMKNDTYSPINLTAMLASCPTQYRLLEKNGWILPVITCSTADKMKYFGGGDSTAIRLPDERLLHLRVRYSPTAMRNVKKYGNEMIFLFQTNLFKVKHGKIASRITTNSFINNFVKDKRGHLWIACYEGGLMELDSNNKLLHRYLPDKPINDVLIDSENGLWISSQSSGLYHCRNLNTSSFGENEPLGHKIQFMKIIDDRLFIASITGDFYFVKNGLLQHMRKSNDAYREPMDIIRSGSGPDYLISWRFILAALTPGREQDLKIIPQVSNAGRITESQPGMIWYTGSRYLGCVNHGKLIRKFASDNKLSDCENRAGSVFVATDKGVIELSPSLISKLTDPKDSVISRKIHFKQDLRLRLTENSVIKRIVKDNADNLWFCSRGEGIYRLSSGNQLTHYTSSNGLPSDIINSISFSSDGSALLSTNKGLFQAQGSASAFENLKWKKIHDEVTFDALIFNAKIYISTNTGLVIQDRDHTADRSSFLLERVRVNSTEISLEKLTELRYDENNLEFELNLISLSGDRAKVSYQLLGPSSEQGSITGPIKFWHLPTGNYTLTAFPAGDRKSELSIPFSIVPAWWQTPVFLFVAVLSSACAILVVTRLIFVYQKKRLTKKLEIEKLISEYKLTALKAQVNPHFMSNCLTAIQNLVYSGHIDKAGDYLARFNSFLRKVLNYSDRQYITLNEELTILKVYTELEQLRFKDGFNFVLEIDELLPLNDIMVPPLIMQPFIENAIWHGLLPLKERIPQLHVKIRREGEFIYIFITDNGVGRSSSEPQPNSRGTKLITDKIEALNQLAGITENKVDITDLFDETGMPAGTEVILRLSYYTLDE